MVKVIINADDLGLNHSVNSAIDDALKERHITSATILANSETWDEVHKVIDENPQASFGVHLNLTQGKALTNNEAFVNAHIVDEQNRFTRGIRKLKRITPEILTAVYEEWDAQLNKVINIEGIQITHIDGHHHIHRETCFLEILVKLVQKYGIKKVRNRYVSPTNRAKHMFSSSIEFLFNRDFVFDALKKKHDFLPFRIVYSILDDLRWRKQLQKYVLMTAYFNSYETQIKQINSGLKINDNTTIELMCHPGHPRYTEEYEQIRTHLLEQLSEGISLISFKEL